MSGENDERFIHEALVGYNLPTEALWEMRRVLEKRCRVKFSLGLSPEGRMAMQQAMEDDSGTRKSAKSGKSRNSRMSEADDKSKGKDMNKEKRSEKSAVKKHLTFSDSFKRSSVRLEGDITDANYSEIKLKKRGIGGKPETALETIEIVNHDDKERDVLAIEATAKLNSIEKCEVWMEVSDQSVPVTPSPESSRSAKITETSNS
ncbi:hypothetical protein CHS0354_006020 [Potamilus streckersoni]|uniref:Uncharacterized protein n=1 Tax=Potamilus streckersoni TaxID=2493646 RepID=A0AAE0VPQ0_9BIVA|nr:hypothetical protein CHS0354_006020 [Potamilus streckersoni]